MPYDGHLTLADGKGKWWDGYDPRQLYGIDLREYKGVTESVYSRGVRRRPASSRITCLTPSGMPRNGRCA